MACRILFQNDRLEFTEEGALYIEDDGMCSYDEVEPEDVKRLYEAMKEYFEKK